MAGNTGPELLRVIAVGAMHIAAYALVGLGLGWVFGRWLRHLTWTSVRRLIWSAAKVLAATIAVGFLLLMSLYVFVFRGVSHSPPPDAIYVDRRAVIEYDAADRWIVSEDIVVPWRAVTADCFSETKRLMSPAWILDARSSYPAQRQWVMRGRRVIKRVEPRGRLTYRDTLKFEPIRFADSVERCLAHQDLMLYVRGSDVALRAPRFAILALDPPAEAKPIPSKRVLYSFTMRPGEPLAIELMHPWLQNEIGAAVRDWNVFAILKWVLVAVVAVFADRIREGFLIPLGRIIPDRFRRKQGSAGFLP